MKKFRLLALLLVLSLALTNFTGCAASEKKEIKATIKEFNEAARNVDMDGMLNCIDPKVAAPINMGTGILGSLLGVDVSEMVNYIVHDVLKIDAESNDFLRTLKIETGKITVNETKATVECTIKYESGSDKYEKGAVLTMTKSGEKWYISSISK